jgi:hypothetical protein
VLAELARRRCISTSCPTSSRGVGAGSCPHPVVSKYRDTILRGEWLDVERRAWRYPRRCVVLSERKTLAGAHLPLQIDDPDARRPEAVEPHLSHDHHRWAFPVEVVLAVALIVPGPSTLAEAEIATRKRPPRPRTRRSAVTFPVGKSSLSARSAPSHHRLYDQFEMGGPGRMCVQRGALASDDLTRRALRPARCSMSTQRPFDNPQRKYRDGDLMTDTTLFGGEHCDGEGGSGL